MGNEMTGHLMKSMLLRESHQTPIRARTALLNQANRSQPLAPSSYLLCLSLTWYPLSGRWLLFGRRP